MQGKYTLKAARAMRNMSQADLAAEIDVERTFYGCMEKRPWIVSNDVAKQICKVLDFKHSDIIWNKAYYTTD